MAKISYNKTIPKVINQTEINSEKVSEMLRKDSKFKEIYDYAEELGYNKLNKSLEIKYDNGANTTITMLMSDNKTAIAILKNFYNSIQDSNCSEQSFLMKFDRINDTITITLFDREGGIIIDMYNHSIISEWGHHSCHRWVCTGFCVEQTAGPLYFQLCEHLCGACFFALADFPILGDEAACIPCFACMGIPYAYCYGNCFNTPCYWYPCQEDCDESDGYYDSPWDYYCDGNNRMKNRQYYDFYCTSNEPQEGYCDFNAYPKDDQYVQTCPYGCDNGYCEEDVTCYSDIECGTDGWLGNPYCSGGDVWQYYREYDCHYPGTGDSYCTYSQDTEKKQDCVGGTCEDGQCVGDVYCEAQYPDYPYYCNDYCVSCGDNDLFNVCCPDGGGEPEYCCPKAGPYCDTSTGECDTCGGQAPTQCNGNCWGCEDVSPGIEVCCPESGNPQWCCNTTNSMCMSDGSCCAPSVETCNNIDDNCDGVIDNFNEGCGVGVCAGGTRTCTTGNWGECSTAGNADDEMCNDVDDDCDGLIDEDLTQECGSDIGACVKGTQTCSAGGWGECGGDYVGPENETCNGIDDNCNGIIDEMNVCGNYPYITLISPINNYVSDNGNVTFNCSVSDDVNLANITLWHNLNGTNYLYPDETKTVTGTNDSVTWGINNINIGNYMWNCLAYDNDSLWSWSENGPFPFTVTIPGLINTLADGSYEKSLYYNQAENQTVYVKILKDSNIINTTIAITGYNVSVYNHIEKEYYWINWTYDNNYEWYFHSNFDSLGWQEIALTSDNPPSGIVFYNTGAPSAYGGIFNLSLNPENVELSLIHLSSSYEGTHYSPISLVINNQYVFDCVSPNSTSYITESWDVTPYVNQGNNTLVSWLCNNMSTYYWIKWVGVNSSAEIYSEVYPSNSSMFINVSSISTPKIWNYSGEYSIVENITEFEDELNDALNNCTADGEGYCNISLIVHSDSAGELKLSDIKIYYEITDNPPNVSLISPSNNNVSSTGNVTFVCNVTDDEELSNITLYTNISGTWQPNQTETITGTSSSTNFTINNIPDDTSFIWNCLSFDNKAQVDWADLNWTININVPNTAPIITNLMQYPTSLYRGENLEIRCAVSDNETTNSSLNVIIQYQNATNNGYIGCADIIYDSTNGYWKCNYTTNYSDDDLGSFDFRCNVSDGEISSGWTTDTDTVTVLNNPPIIYSCQDDNIYENTLGSDIQINLDDCSSDIEDSDNNLIYQINNQTDSSLINCYINNHNITCNNPTQYQHGYSYLTVQVNDTDEGTNVSYPLILITVNAFPDIHRFYIKNVSGSNVAWLGNEGNILLKGTCTSGGACTAPLNSFIIQDSAGGTAAYIDPNGNLCIETGDCSDKSATCNNVNNAFIIKNQNDENKIFIDYTGDLCLTGTLTQGGNP